MDGVVRKKYMVGLSVAYNLEVKQSKVVKEYKVD